jgi:hypothetical protein
VPPVTGVLAGARLQVQVVRARQTDADFGVAARLHQIRLVMRSAAAPALQRLRGGGLGRGCCAKWSRILGLSWVERSAGRGRRVRLRCACRCRVRPALDHTHPCCDRLTFGREGVRIVPEGGTFGPRLWDFWLPSVATYVEAMPEGGESGMSVRRANGEPRRRAQPRSGRLRLWVLTVAQTIPPVVLLIQTVRGQ